MWSPASLAPALPGRSMAASGSFVVSHHTPRGKNPKPFLFSALGKSGAPGWLRRSSDRRVDSGRTNGDLRKRRHAEVDAR